MFTLYIYMYVCLLYIYIYIYICMYVFTHTLTHKWLLSFQESFGFSWLPGIHLAHVNTK